MLCTPRWEQTQFLELLQVSRFKQANKSDEWISPTKGQESFWGIILLNRENLIPAPCPMGQFLNLNFFKYVFYVLN